MSGGLLDSRRACAKALGAEGCGASGCSGCPTSTAHGAVSRMGILRATPQQKGGGRERCWGRGGASLGGRRAVTEGVRAEETGPVCLLHKGLGW